MTAHDDQSQQSITDLADLALVRARMAMDDGSRFSLDEVLTMFGYTRESLAALPDDDEAAAED